MTEIETSDCTYHSPLTALKHGYLSALCLVAGLAALPGSSFAQTASLGQTQACEALQQVRNLTITEATVRENDQSSSPYCYVRGIISPAIHFHAQLPFIGNWNGRFLQWGDGGPGPNSWDKLVPLVDWVENGVAPESLTATHSTDGNVDDERLLCTFPQQATFSGPAGTENNRDNWVAANFSCQ